MIRTKDRPSLLGSAMAGVAACCARTGTDPAATVPPTAVMNSRRLIGCSPVDCSLPHPSRSNRSCSYERNPLELDCGHLPVGKFVGCGRQGIEHQRGPRPLAVAAIVKRHFVQTIGVVGKRN